MKNKKIVPIILVSISIVLFIVAIIILLNTNYLDNSNKNTNKESNNQTEEKENNNEESTNKTEKEDSNTKEEIKQEDNNSEEENNITDKETNTNQKEDNNQITQYTEEDVVSYFSLREKEIGTNQEDKSLREKVKESFTSIVDFIFYDKEIKGYTFDELTTSTKLKVIEIALSIDNKIDKYFPDYKNTIKDKYTDIKGKLAVKYLEFTENLCNNVGTDTCNQAKEDFNTMKESFGFTWELIKELAKSGSTKVKEFYESWKDSE